MAQLLKRVERGDIITADMWNEVVDTINAMLQSTQTPGIKVSATVPEGTSTNPLRIGTLLQIVGQSFGFSLGQTSVIFEWSGGKVVVPHAKLLTGSADDRLLLIVPAIPGLPQSGTTMSMSVDNGVALDSRSVVVQPVKINLEGDIFVNWRTDLAPNPNPNPLQPRAAAEFAYQLKAGTNLPATFTLSADLDDATVKVPSSLLESILFIDALDRSELKDKTIKLGKTETRNIIVRIPLIPDEFADQSFRLIVKAEAGSVSNASSRPFTVGKKVAENDKAIHPDRTAVRILDEANNDTADPKDGSFDGATIRLRPGKQALLLYSVTLDQKGEYDVSLKPKEGTTLKGWNPFTFPAVVPVAVDKDTVPKDVQFSLSVDPAGASETGTVVFTLKRKGATLDWSEEFDVELLK